MQIIPVKPIPSQTLSFVDSGNNSWNIEIRLTELMMSFSFTRNSNVLITGIHAVAGYRIIPYNYLEDGNFVLVTQNQEVPDYNKFGLTQSLVFLSQQEILAFRAPMTSLARVSVSDFDPNGALPLRFAPTGYVLAP